MFKYIPKYSAQNRRTKCPKPFTLHKSHPHTSRAIGKFLMLCTMLSYIHHPYILTILKYFLSERLKAPVVTTHQKSYRVYGVYKRRGVFLNPRRGDQAHDGWLLRGDVADNGCHRACHLASPLGHLRYMPPKYPPTLQNNTKHVFWWNACLTPQDCTTGLQIWSTTMPRLHHVTPHDFRDVRASLSVLKRYSMKQCKLPARWWPLMISKGISLPRLPPAREGSYLHWNTTKSVSSLCEHATVACMLYSTTSTSYVI